MYLFLHHHLFIFYYAILNIFDFQEKEVNETNNQMQRCFLHCIAECHILVLFVRHSRALHLTCTTVEIKVLNPGILVLVVVWGILQFTTLFLLPGIVHGMGWRGYSTILTKNQIDKRKDILLAGMIEILFHLIF